MNTRVLSAVVVVLSLCAAALAVGPTATSQPTTRPRITPGYDTTRLTAPLRANGTVDYLAAINQAHSKGVTPANNAAVKLLEAIGPQNMIIGSIRDETLKQLGVTVPATGQYFQDYPTPATSNGPTPYEQAQKGSWRAGEHPELVAWLEKNKAPLARFLEASQRPRYFAPILILPEQKALGVVSATPPGMAPYRNLARAMVIRANLAVAEGRTLDAWRDLLAVHRMGRLMDQDSSVLARLVGIACCALADTATQAMLASGTLTADQAQQVLKDLSALSPTPTAASCIDLERYGNLDFTTILAARPGTLEQFMTYSGGGRPKDARDEMFIKLLSGAMMASDMDWNVVLRSFNRYYDEVQAGMRLPTFAQRTAAMKKIDAEIQEFKRRATQEIARRAAQPPIATSEPASPPGQPNAKTRWAADVVMGIVLPPLGRAQILADGAAVRRDMTLLAAGLAVYKTQNGKYPATLAALSPAILKTVPRDIFSGKPFLYKSTSQGYLLYSVGENMTDDNATDKAAGGDDIVLKTPK